MRSDKRTKNLVKRLSKGDIAVIDHEDIDRVSAEALISCDVAAVVNASRSTTGSYPNTGPLLLLQSGVVLLDNVGESAFADVDEGQEATIDGERLVVGGKTICRGKRYSEELVLSEMEASKSKMEKVIENFAINTIDFLKKEKGVLFDEGELPETRVDLQGRPVLMVVRGYHYREDLTILKPFIYDRRPVLIGVDGGGDALLEEGFIPDILIGDMDSVSDDALKKSRELIVHAYADGSAPGKKRLDDLGLGSQIFKAPGTSEDIAMLLAYEKGADVIVAVGTHLNVTEFLDKGRKGMASTFLVRLKVGTKLVDAKGVNQLYPKKVKASQLAILVLAALTPLVAVMLLSSSAREIIFLVATKLRLLLGY